ncbi:GNAT family N-acetyltransferase [Paenibacillus koleovorans]|uniref:GNAT family N-acetyltransferase n=1 Tax=Paenibacillus koleovorans TaxID=121608 RepID=UPI0013E2BE71|nr:GNAT family N-acetyltransferase [Paenibacillus koleovorans]
MRTTVEYESVRHFMQRVEEPLERDESANNLILGLLYMLRDKERRGESAEGNVLMTVEDDEGALCLAALLNPINLVVASISAQGDGSAALSAASLTTHVLQSGWSLPGIVGPLEASEAIAKAWAAKSRQIAIVKMNQKIYRLDQVCPGMVGPGELVCAEAEHQQLVADWLFAFSAAVGEALSREAALQKAADDIRSRSIYLWRTEAGIVSMAKRSRPTRNGIVIAIVYTPPEHRKMGYASSCVASLSQLLLEQGFRFCSLYTDLANPTSNKIYMDIGYRPIQDSILYRFRDR